MLLRSYLINGIRRSIAFESGGVPSKLPIKLALAKIPFINMLTQIKLLVLVFGRGFAINRGARNAMPVAGTAGAKSRVEADR
jgi:hypothetical protein